LTDNLEARVASLIATSFEVSVDEVELTADLQEALSLDSVGVLEVVMLLEDSFQVVIPETQWPSTLTVQNLARALQSVGVA
jgi:acyl carrier protein